MRSLDDARFLSFLDPAFQADAAAGVGAVRAQGCLARPPIGAMVFPFVWLLAVLLVPTVSFGESLHRSPHLEHTEWILGAKIIQFNAWETEKEEGEGEEPSRNKDVTLHGVGGGVFVERSVLRHIFEIELSVSAVALEGDVTVPIDLLLKKPFHFGPYVNTYLGVGPALTIDIKDDETDTYGGIAFATGLYHWFDDHLGVDLDLDYTLVFKNGLAHELQIALGPVWRF